MTFFHPNFPHTCHSCGGGTYYTAVNKRKQQNIYRGRYYFRSKYYTCKQYAKRHDTFSRLDQIIMMTKQLLEKMEDTQIQAGSKAYASALTLYNLFVAAADAGLGGTNAIVSLLKQRFADQGETGTPAVNPN